jgi:hypothetical protein
MDCQRIQGLPFMWISTIAYIQGLPFMWKPQEVSTYLVKHYIYHINICELLHAVPSSQYALKKLQITKVCFVDHQEINVPLTRKKLTYLWSANTSVRITGQLAMHRTVDNNKNNSIHIFNTSWVVKNVQAIQKSRTRKFRFGMSQHIEVWWNQLRLGGNSRLCF